MPLDEIGRRYANTLFQNRLEEIIESTKSELGKVRADFAKRHMVMSGGYVSAQAKVYADQIRRLGEAKADSLLQAYARAGIAFGDAALGEVKAEVMEYCHQQQHTSVAAIGRIVQQTFGNHQNATPNGIERAVVDELVRDVSVIMARLGRDLSLKRDEVILDDSRRKAYAAGIGKKWDVFICHASEDKEDFVRPLADALQSSGLSVWYDESTLKIGDSLRRKIDEGLANSRYGIVVLSRSFFAKNWPQHELDGMLARELATGGVKVILPIWHNITLEEIRAVSPTLAGRVAAKSNDGVTVVVAQLRDAMGV